MFFDLRIYIVLLVNVCLVYVLSAVNSELAPVLYILTSERASCKQKAHVDACAFVFF